MANKNNVITLSKVDNKKEVLGYVQVLDSNDNTLSKAQIDALEDKNGLRAFVRGTSIDDFAGELNIEHGQDIQDNDKDFRNEVIEKMALIDAKFEFVKFFNKSTAERTNMGLFFSISDMV